MKTIPDKFLQALQLNDYSVLKNTLKLMTYESAWAGKIVAEQVHDSLIECDNPWYGSNYDKDYYWVDTRSIDDWTPLTEAAYCLNETAIQLILARWPEQAADLVKRTYSSLNKAYDYFSVKYEQDKKHGFSTKCLLDLNTIVQANVLIRYHMSTINPSFQYNHNKINNESYSNYLALKILDINSTEDLITFYETYIAGGLTNHQQCSGFFPITRIYSDINIKLITILHEHAYTLLLRQGDTLGAVDNSTSEAGRRDLKCQQALLLSNVFSEKHYQCGVSTQSIRNLMHEVLTDDPQNLNYILTPAFMSGKKQFEPSNVAVAVELSLLSTLFSTLSHLLECVSGLFNGFIMLVQQAITATINVLSGHVGLEKEKCESSIPTNGL